MKLRFKTLLLFHFWKKEKGVKALPYNFEHAAFTRTLLRAPKITGSPRSIGTKFTFISS